MIRIAAIADTHIGIDGAEPWRDAFARVSDEADLLLLGGDLTRIGAPREARAVTAALERVRIPVVAVLGNHDFHASRAGSVASILLGAGVHLLEGGAWVRAIGGVRVGIAGVKGFGGGFANACGGEFGEREMKSFIRHTRRTADRLRRSLATLEADLRIALLHYSPIEATLHGERCEIYPWLGSYLLGEAIDEAGADFVIHGHAHGGAEKGSTPAGIPVRNVAQPVIRAAYRIYCFGRGSAVECSEVG